MVLGILLNATVFAQLEGIHFTINTNVPFLPTYEEEIGDSFVTDPTSGFQEFVAAYTLTEKYNSSPGISISVLPTFKLSDRWSLRAGISSDFLRFSRFLESSTGPEPIVESDGDEVSLINLNIPVDLNYQFFENFSVGLGIQLSNRIYSKETVDVFIPNPNNFGFQISEEDITDGKSFTDGQFWITTNIDYMISDRIGATISFRKSFHKVYSNEALTQGSAKLGVLDLGFIYNLKIQ